MTDPVLVLDKLGKDFGAHAALVDLTCNIHSNEVVGLLGPNGAGKTTTMKLILGLLRPSRGSATFHSAHLALDCTRDARSVKERLGYSPDEPAFYDFLTGHETLDFVLNVRSAPAAVRDRLPALIDALELGASLDAPTASYSLGTKKKLALLLALAHEPGLLLLDEPTNGLDPPTAARVRALLRARAEAGAAVVVSTHLLEMADVLCDRVLVLHRGRLVAEGSPAAVRAQAGVAESASLEAAFLELVK
ncbi:MAG: ABC transporter ATP-binding protein [Labilithrix sp.]|nr:ABC transporter ATP-binding protein [Labilithrix sp.]MCW5812297.1 ABC transporter ATP-binding protein [Labilithrix sp.]